jgi:hypothetical protein
MTSNNKLLDKYVFELGILNNELNQLIKILINISSIITRSLIV